MPTGRRLGVETLEDRRLLSVSAAEYSVIRDAYTEFDLPAALTDVNVIEITSLSVANLKSAIVAATQGSKRDLILLRTTDASHSITFTAAGDRLSFQFDAASSRGITIVAWGSAPLTVDAAGLNRTLYVTAGDIQFGNVIFTGSRGTYGGFVYAESASVLAFKNCVMTHSTASASAGAVFNAGQLTLIGCSVTENVSGKSGGGLYNTASGTMTLLSSFVAGNDSAASGGGIFNQGVLRVINSVVAGNRATGSGGGIYSSNALLTNAVIVGNASGTYGGGLYSCGSATVNNSILAYNKAVYGAELYTSTVGTSAHVNASLIFRPDNGIASVTDDAGSNLYYVSPSFVSYVDYTSWNAALWRSWDLSLSETSPAVDAGKISRAVDADGKRLVADIDDHARIFGGAVDMGAYERQGSATPETVTYSTYSAGGQTRYYYYAGTFFDAEKKETDDVHRCWSASLSNVLFYTGWGKINGTDAGGSVYSMNSEDDLFAYFSDNMIYEWGYARDAFHWFLTGEISSEWLLDPVFVGGGFYPAVDSWFYYFGRAYNATIGSVVMDGIASTLRRGGGVYLAIGWYNNETNTETGNHLLTAWGYEVDPSKDPSDPNYYTALYIADPDSSMAWSFGAIDELTRMPILWDSNVNQYRFDNGSTIRIDGFAWVDAMPDAYLSTKETPSAVVTTTRDVVDPSDGLISLREALEYADEGGTVTFDATRIHSGDVILLSGEQLTVKKSLTIDASALWNEAESVPGLSINANGASRVFNTVNNVHSSNITLIGLTLTGGRVEMTSTDNADGNAFGAAIYNTAHVTLTDCVVIGNETTAAGIGTKQAHSAGGAVFNTGTFIAMDCRFEDNKSTALTESGSSYAYGGTFNNAGVMTLDGCLVWGSSVLSRSIGSGYASSKGGAVMNSGTLTVFGSLLSGNACVAISNTGGAASYGGAFRNSGTAVIMGSVFSGNEATASSTVGSATGYGGAISSNTDAVSLVITQSTVAGNHASSYGGGIYNWSLLTVNNSIFARNREGSANSDIRTNSSAGTTTVNDSLVYKFSGRAAAIDDPESVLIGTLPMFVSYSNYTVWSADLWKSWDLHLKPASPAVDAGRNSLAVDERGNVITVDLDGNRRIDGGTVDLGAYETVTTVPLAVPTDLMVTSAGANRFAVSWNAVSGAVGYTLAQSVDQRIWTETPVSNHSAVITGLTYGATVYFRVQALGDGEFFTDSGLSKSVGKIVSPMDIDGDGVIGPADRILLSRAWFTGPTKTNWDLRGDLDGDGFIGPVDRNYLSVNWMKSTASTDLVYPPAADTLHTAVDFAMEEIMADSVIFSPLWTDPFLTPFGQEDGEVF